MFSGPGTEHRATFINACVHDLKVIVLIYVSRSDQRKGQFGARAYLWKEVFICEMHSSFLWRRANFVATFNETLILRFAVSSHIFIPRSGVCLDVPSSLPLLSLLRPKGHDSRGCAAQGNAPWESSSGIQNIDAHVPWRNGPRIPRK